MTAGDGRPTSFEHGVRAGERFTREVTLDPAEVARFAAASGDDNPLHHDPEHASGTRLRRPIASGTQTCALLMGLCASWFARHGAMLGLEFSFRF